MADRPNVLPTWVFTQPLRRFGILRQTAHASASLGMRVLKRWALRCLTVFLIFLAPVCPLSPSSVILIMHCAWVYFLTNKRHTILYVGVTNNLATRLWEHRSKKNPKCFTARYNIDKLVYYEAFTVIVEAIAREKIIKGESRKWNEVLVEK